MKSWTCQKGRMAGQLLNGEENKQRVQQEHGEETEDIRKKAETDVEEKAETEDPRDAETKLLILEYQKNTYPDFKTLKIIEFWGGEEWREDKGEDMRICIWRLVEDELV